MQLKIKTRPVGLERTAVKREKKGSLKTYKWLLGNVGGWKIVKHEGFFEEYLAKNSMK